MNSHDFEDSVYVPAGVNLDTLGCVMLDVALPPKLTGVVVDGEVRSPRWYKTKHADRFWIKGEIEHGHVTLLYGLLKSLFTSEQYVAAIDSVLHYWSRPSDVEVESVGFFPSPYKDDDAEYACIIAHVKISSELLDAHQRLSFIPHVDTFPDYKAHVTLGYVEKSDLIYALAYFRAMFERDDMLPTTGLDYGKMP